MHRATVTCCDSGKLSVEAETQTELAFAIAAAVLRLHATKPHCEHEIRFESGPLPADDGDLELRCLVSGCDERKNAASSLKTRCPIALVPAIALCFHSAHEGHAFSIRWNGREWATPVL